MNIFVNFKRYSTSLPDIIHVKSIPMIVDNREHYCHNTFNIVPYLQSMETLLSVSYIIPFAKMKTAANTIVSTTVSVMVEMRGIEPLSKRSPTFRRLQFSLMVDKTVTCPSDVPSLNLPVICRDHLTDFRVTLSIFNTQLPSNGIRQRPVRCST